MTGRNRRRSKLYWGVGVFFLAFLLVATRVSAVETNTASSEADAALLHQIAQSNQQLQEQQQTVLHALDQARQDAEAIAKRNNDAVDARLQRIEDSVNAQRERELENLQKSHRFTLIIVGIFAGVGFFGMLFFALFLLRLMNRRTELMFSQFTGQPLGSGFAPTALGTGEQQLVATNRVEQSTSRFLNTIEQLEKRIDELEGTAEPEAAVVELPKKAAEPKPVVAEASIESSEPKVPAEPETAAARAKNDRAERDARIALLLGKGQA